MAVDRTPSVDVYALARERAEVAGSVALQSLPRLAESLFSTAGELRYTIRGELDERGRPGAAMSLAATLVLQCQRCNGPLDFPLERMAHFRFVDSEQTLNALPIEDDDTDVIVGSEHMPLWPWLEDEAILSLPLVPRHAACALPAEVAAPADAATDAAAPPNPFAALAALRRDKPADA